MEPSSKPADQFTSVFFCFRFDRSQLDYRQLTVPFTKSNGKQTLLWQPEPVHTYHLKNSVAEILQGGETALACCYALDDSTRRDLGLPEARTPAQFFCRTRPEPVTVRLQKVSMALFRTGVGILELSFRCEEDLPALIDLNYGLCEVKSEANYLRFPQQLGKDLRQERTLRLLAGAARLLEPLGCVQDFDAKDGLRYIDNKPVVFTYVLLPRFPASLGEDLFHLRTNFKTSYQVPAGECTLEDNPHLYHPFENLYWGFSLNAVVCCAALTGSPETDRFFRTTFRDNLLSTYKPLYLLRLHQRFEMQNLQDRIALAGAELNAAEGSRIEAVYRAAAALRAEAAMFRLQLMFNDPSSVEHINRYDTELSEDMRLEEQFAALRYDLQLLEQLSQAAKERIARREETEHRIRVLRRERIIYLASALWGMVLLFESACEILDRFFPQGLRFPNPWMLLPAAIAAVPGLKLFYDFREKGRELKRLEESLK